jgi:ABC-2 type transport system permease protein
VRLLWSELRLRRTALVIWVGAIGLLVLMIAAVYPSVRDSPSLDAIYGDLSPAAQQLLGGSDLTSPAGYLSTQVFAFFLPAVILVYGLSRASATVAGEEEERTLDLLLAQPVARWDAYVQKALAVVVGLAALGMAALIPLLALNGPVEFDLPVGNIAAVVTQMTLFCLALAMWTQAISAATGRRALGLATVVGYLLVAYLVYGLSPSIAWLQHLMPLSLWRWYLGNDPLTTGFGGTECLVLLATAVAGALVGSWLFDRRDLHA